MRSLKKNNNNLNMLIFYANVMAVMILDLNIFISFFFAFIIGCLVLGFICMFRERGRSHVSLTSSSRDPSMMVIWLDTLLSLAGRCCMISMRPVLPLDGAVFLHGLSHPRSPSHETSSWFLHTTVMRTLIWVWSEGKGLGFLLARGNEVTEGSSCSGCQCEVSSICISI